MSRYVGLCHILHFCLIEGSALTESNYGKLKSYSFAVFLVCKEGRAAVIVMELYQLSIKIQSCVTHPALHAFEISRKGQGFKYVKNISLNLLLFILMLC